MIILCVPFKGGVCSQYPSSSPKHKLHWFSKPGIWVLISLLQYLEACVPDVAFESFIHLEERSVPLKSLSIVNYCIWSVGFSLVSLYLHLPYWSHWCSFNLFCGSFIHPAFRFLSHGVISYAIVDLLSVSV